MSEIRFKKIKDYTYAWEVQKKNNFFGFEFWYTVETHSTSYSNPSYEELVLSYASYNRRSNGKLRFFKMGDSEWLCEELKSFLGFEYWAKAGKFYLNTIEPPIEELVSTFFNKKREVILYKPIPV